MLKTAYIGASRDSAGTGRGHFEDLTDYGFAFQPSPRGPRRIPRMDGFMRGLIDGLKKEGALPTGFKMTSLVKKYRGPRPTIPVTTSPNATTSGTKPSFMGGLGGHLNSFAKGLNPEMMMQGMHGMGQPQAQQQPAPPPTPEEEQRKRERSRSGLAGGLGLHGAM